MSLISLEGSVRTCKVNTAWANRIQSDRFENPKLMLCATWNGMDNAGRPVSADSYMTKTAGCNSALDRVDVENYLRPQYTEYASLDAAGIQGQFYDPNIMFSNDVNSQETFIENFAPRVAGHWATSPTYGTNVTSCGHYPYELAQKQKQASHRHYQS